jgi:hypothetical protein
MFCFCVLFVVVLYRVFPMLSVYLAYLLEVIEGSLHHKHEENNRRVAEHNSYPLEYQSFVETHVQQTQQIKHMDDLVLFIFIIRFWMGFDKARFVSTNNKILIPCSPFFFEKQRWINSLILDFSSVCGIVIYKVEKSNVLMVLQTY